MKAFEARPPLTGFVVAAGLAAYALSVGAALLVETLATGLLGADHSLPMRPMQMGAQLALMAVVVAPLTETLLVLLVVLALSRLTQRRGVVVVLTALLAGAAHGPYPHTFAATSLAFAVYAYAALTWRVRGWWRAYAAAAWPHAISNGLLLVTDVVASGSGAAT